MSSKSSSTPSIRVYESSRYALPHHHRSSHPSPSVAMAIPSSARGEAPPPLPPPRYLHDLGPGQDPGFQWGLKNSHGDTGFGENQLASVRTDSSLHGGAFRSGHPRPRVPSADYVFRGRQPSESRSPDFDMSEENSEDHSDENQHVKTRPSLGSHRLTSERQLGAKALQNSSHAYDKQLLSKIGGPNTPTRNPSASLPSGPPDLVADAHVALHKLNGQLKPLSVPDRLHPGLEYPGLESPASKWAVSGALSPTYSGFRSPGFESSSVDLSKRHFGSISSTGPLDEVSSQHRGSYDHSVFSDHDFAMEENGMRDLNINDRSPAESEEYQLGPKGGLKRRASSPPSEAAREDRPTTSGHTDLYHRRSAQMLVNRSTGQSRFQAHPSSLSSTSSLGQRSGSIGSSFGFSTAASSMTSYGGDQRVSPNALSPLGETDVGSASPYAASRTLNRSPRASLSRPQQQSVAESDHSQIRKMSAENVLNSRRSSVASRIPGAYICDCCPKKPKKFDNEEELRLHELEKQYVCQYCANRFKNKNEAERHQNSLHLRRYS